MINAKDNKGDNSGAITEAAMATLINAKDDKRDFQYSRSWYIHNNSVTITEAMNVSKDVRLNDTDVDNSAGCHSDTDGEVISLILC